jgi:hypothetical protein
MSITIEGLTARQRVFADCLWKLNGREQVRGFILSLPREFQPEAETVMSMMLAAVFDRADTVSPELEAVLKCVAKKQQ